MSSQGVLIVEDDATLRDALSDTLRSNNITVVAAASGHEALSILDREDIGLVVSDVQMEPMNGHELLSAIRQRDPGLPAILMTAYGTIAQAVDAMRDGAADYLVKPIEADALVEVVNRYLNATPDADGPVAVDPRSLELLRVARRVAGCDATVTISGESGCGKEIIARYIHEHSLRKDEPFVAINCAAIPENMLEAVLFGYEKGSFTGASAAHPGKFEQAQGGTLLLDEISEMDIGLQAKLLRVIQEREVERIGGRKTIALDVRVLATTNRNLRESTQRGEFREDLYYRLNVFPLRILPLRDRPGDILPLANLAIDRHYDTAQQKPQLTAGAVEQLLAYSWPGNVRELENLIQRSLILLRGNSISTAELAFETDSGMSCVEDVGADSTVALQDNLKNREQQIIIDALSNSNGNRAAVAKKLDISPRTLRYKIARLRKAGVALPCTSAAGTAQAGTA